jgi:hypothetical protein
MNVGPFAYLLQGDKGQQTKVAADRLEILSKIAAKRYLEEQVPLNDTITKLARENELNSNQIERVCEMANIATHRGLWTKTAQKEKISYPLADAKIVKQACGDGCGGGPEMPTDAPCNDMDSDYAGPPKGIPLAGPSLSSMMGVDPNGGHNGMTDVPEGKRIVIILQKRAAERADIRSKLLMRAMELETLEKQAFHVVKQAVLGGQTFRQIYEAANGMGLGKQAADLLPGFEERLIADTHGEVHNRLVKHAISRAPADLISDNLGNMTIINGANPVLISLDTIRRKTGEVQVLRGGLVRINDEVKMYNQKLRELS